MIVNFKSGMFNKSRINRIILNMKKCHNINFKVHKNVCDFMLGFL